MCVFIKNVHKFGVVEDLQNLGMSVLYILIKQCLYAYKIQLIIVTTANGHDQFLHMKNNVRWFDFSQKVDAFFEHEVVKHIFILAYFYFIDRQKWGYYIWGLENLTQYTQHTDIYFKHIWKILTKQ